MSTVTTLDTLSKNAINLHLGECLDQLRRVPDRSIDCVMVDLPYGTTRCEWDSVINLEELWRELKRVGTEDAHFIFTAQHRFMAQLLASNLKDFKYDLVWEKANGTNPLTARHRPINVHENILVFRQGKSTYNPQMEEGKPYVIEASANRRAGEAGGIKGDARTIVNHGTRHPRSVLRFAREKNAIHPTQKPLELMRWLVRTYTNPGDRILDCTMGSGTTGVAAALEGRGFVGIELDPGYFAHAVERIRDAAKVSKQKVKVIPACAGRVEEAA